MTTTLNKKDFDSSWEYTRNLSKYHFDNTRHDRPGEWFTPLGRFIGDWSREVAEVVEKDLDPITWATRKYSPYFTQPDGTLIQSDMLLQEERDLQQIGAPVDLKLTDVVELDDFAPVFKKMVDYIGLDTPWCRLHVQRPGQMFNLHIDKLYDRSPENPTENVRLVVHLADWEPGQFYCYGTHTMTHWRAGDVHTFDWPNVPHATANASRNSRPTLIMTGLKTNVTHEFLNNAKSTSLYPV